MTTRIDRKAVVSRHDVVSTQPHPEHVVTVGNGDFAFTADMTGMQSFADFHDQQAALQRESSAVNTATMSTWGWHEMPNPEGFVLDDAMSTYHTPRGPIRYPDRYDISAAMRGEVADEYRAGAWLHTNPQRIDLGRIGLEFRPEADSEPLTRPDELEEAVQRLDLWTGQVESTFSYSGVPVAVSTVAAPDSAAVAFRINTSLFRDGRARVVIRFPYASEHFLQTADWEAPDRHTSALTLDGEGKARISRTLDASRYVVTFQSSSGTPRKTTAPHTFELLPEADELELVVRFTTEEGDVEDFLDFPSVAARSAASWERFWMSGAAVDFSGSSDPRAFELERRVVLSQYLTKVNCSGSVPPSETGLITNSWQGKFHLEMHFWHAAHFATWGRPELLEPSLSWYRSILPSAQEIARRQGYAGARWPKHVGPDGRESPDPTNSLLAWQQPNILYLLELTYRASEPRGRARLVEEYSEVVRATAAFMADFPDRRDDGFHLGPPIMPAQEFYDSRSTQDPTFELAYWWWGLEIAQRWQERRGLDRLPEWEQVQDKLARPAVRDGQYLAVAGDAELRRDDHPALLSALGVVPTCPLIDPDIMNATLNSVLDDWEWPTAWGWDFAVLAMTATRLNRGATAVEALLRDEVKNRFTLIGHNSQGNGLLPLYLPGNGALLAAVSLMAAGADKVSPVFPQEGWSIRAEGFIPWP